MKKLFNSIFTINKWLGFIAGLFILIASFLMAFEVIMRYFVEKPTSWTYDTTRYLLLCIAFFSVAFALQEKAHINVDFLLERVRNNIRKILILSSDFVVLIFSCFVFWYSYLSYVRAVEGGWKTLGTFIIPTSWLYIVILLGSIVLAITTLALFFLHSKDQDRKG